MRELLTDLMITLPGVKRRRVEIIYQIDNEYHQSALSQNQHEVFNLKIVLYSSFHLIFSFFCFIFFPVVQHENANALNLAWAVCLSVAQKSGPN